MRRCRCGGISRRSARASVRGDPATYPCRADPSLYAPGAPRIRRLRGVRRRHSTTSRTSIRTQQNMAARFLPPVAARSRAAPHDSWQHTRFPAQGDGDLDMDHQEEELAQPNPDHHHDVHNPKLLSSPPPLPAVLILDYYAAS